MQKIDRVFYSQQTERVAQEILGTYLIYQKHGEKKVGRIVETEAYLGGHDLASHSSKGITKRTQTMFGEPGHAYVYMIYGMHYCFNIVTEPKGKGSAVLIRAIEPIQNISANTKGPALLCKALGIDKSDNQIDLTGDDIFLACPDNKTGVVVVSRPRIGVQYAKEWALKPLRFYIKDNPYISRP